MYIEQIGEAGLIQRIKNKFPTNDRSIAIGIGDDAAIINPSSRKALLFSTDTIRENIHFSRKYCTFYDIGWKSVAVSISDIAAMGGLPRYLLLSIAVPPKISVKEIDNLLDGVADISTKYGVSVVGGNLSGSKGGVTIDTTIIGEVSSGKALLRSGAKVGDLIYVTGVPGSSAIGLSMKTPSEDFMKSHLRPVPRVREGIILSENKLATAAIDISDGLLSDLGHICERSSVGARIYANLLPLPVVPHTIRKRLAKAPLFFALYGGEDYELLFTIKGKNRTKLETISKRERVKFTIIGEIVPSVKGIRLVGENRKETEIEPHGYDHFKSGRRRLC